MENIIIFDSALGLMILFVIWIQVKKYLLDEFRERLFDKRNQLFLFAIDNDVNFSSDAYRATREYINGRIQYLHRVSVTELFVQHVMLRNHRGRIEEVASSFAARIQSAGDRRVVDYFKSVIEQADILTIKYGLYSTPLVGIPFYVYRMLWHLNFPSLNQRGKFRKDIRKQFGPALEWQLKEYQLTKSSRIPRNGQKQELLSAVNY